ncbi:MAG TPA: ribonuclease E/G [Vitreimonas sp.]|uniref:Rne/Rng family ribonuclease n=1 Tax=Vitreimonas sp. TaxID=3069702 RepID=UPI002D67818C|nr:ribonuclease E/G [Vitreimonas sp.]HYD88397.1 ribonuclease E/G [Vitreimonas sp.]
MAKKMLIDAAHPEETRVAVLDGNRVEDFDFEVASRKQLRGNIYLAKVTRVEPSLQAAFIEYGGNRHGFLAFSEIHPDYYAIPHADQEAIKAELAAAEEESEGEEEDEEARDERRRRILTRRYKIQEVIRRRQIMLIQVVKEERGNKGAALTTYLSLAGRYCVLMPNTGRGGGISRKITQATDRKRLKKIAQDLDVPQGQGLIIRTAGAKRTKTEIKRDYEYLSRAWETIRDDTLKSVAPALIYEESSLVKRAIRDLYDKDVDEIHVEGESAYKEAKDFVRMLMPSHAKRVQLWKDATPIFTKTGVEKQLESIYSPVVTLKSGGYIVINQTEALVAIDVNSGRATRERNIEQTAFKTNCEAADEAARQMRLRDLAGLIVIDFIDMEEQKNDRAVEKRMKENLRFDRARVQMGKISGFGLLELSRQRRRTGVLEGTSHICEHCQGTGRVRSIESAALALLRALDDASIKQKHHTIEARTATEVALYLLNEKREALAAIEENRNVRVRVTADGEMTAGDFEINIGADTFEDEREEEVETPARRGKRAVEVEAEAEDAEAAVEVEDEEPEAEETVARAETEGERRGRRRRGRRGGRRRRGEGEGESAEVEAREEAETEAPRIAAQEERADRGRGGRRRRRGRGRGRRVYEVDGGEWLDFVSADLKHLSPRPERVRETRAIEAEQVEDAGEQLAVEETADIILHPAAEAAQEPIVAPAIAETAEAGVVEVVDEDAAPREEQPNSAYEPDQERREKFFSRLSRWSKK